MPTLTSRPAKLHTALIGACALVAATGLTSWGASHSDAPLSKQDPQANITDVYSFIGAKYDDPEEKVLNVIVHVRPFSEPGDGVIYDRFGDDLRYSIHITHPATGAETRRYDFQFSAVNPQTAPGLKNPNTVLSYGLGTEVGPIQDVGDARQNYTQTYNVTRVVGPTSTPIASGLLTPPPNVGQRTTPAYNDAQGKAVSGAINFASLDSYTQQTIYSLPSGEAVFAGPREDGFYSDIPGIFDLLNPRILGNSLGQGGGGVDGFKGFNILTFAIQIPVDDLRSFPYTAPFANLAAPLPSLGTATGVGVYASVSRQRLTLRKTDGNALNSGPWVQVNRMGNPLFNEGLVALKDKDRFNRTSPTIDADPNLGFATYALNPELAFLINTVFGTNFATTGRADLALVFIPEVLRVDTTTPPVRLSGQPGFNRLGFIGGDTTAGLGGIKSGGWPNGRRLGDDVVDIALTAIASGPAYTTVTLVGDNVPSNDQLFNQVFPYSGTPHSGTLNRKDP